MKILLRAGSACLSRLSAEEVIKGRGRGREGARWREGSGGKESRERRIKAER